jgi:surface polysaccharide O-acyltransferase-like enzyme
MSGDRTSNHFKRWGAVYILAVLFVASLAGQWFTQLAEYAADQATHGQPFEWSGYVAAFLAEMFANWESEMLQLAVQALLISAYSRFLFRKGDEDAERLEAKVDELLARLPESGR